MIRRPPRSTRTDTLFPYTTLFRSGRVCEQNGIEHRLTKPYHPWTNGQAERMVRTIKEATVKSFRYTSINELRRHVRDWLVAYNFAKQLKALRFTPTYEATEELRKSNPAIFNKKTPPHLLVLDRRNVVSRKRFKV